MRRFLVFVSAFCFFLLCGAENVFGCSCMLDDKPLGVQVKRAFKNSTAIFSAEVISVTDDPADEYSLIVKMKVGKYWKGKIGKEVVVKTARQSAMCGYYFEVDHNYVVYAFGEKTEMKTDNCSRTSGYQGNADVKFLNRLKKPRKA